MEKQNNTQTNQMIALQTNTQPVAVTPVNFMIELDENVISKINELMEDSFYLDDMLDFINEHGEDNFIKYYNDYVRFGEDNSYGAVDAFIEEFGIWEVERFEDAYQGEWESPEVFTEVYCQDMGYTIPDFVVVDWEATWERNLYYDFAFNNGYVFNKNY